MRRKLLYNIVAYVGYEIVAVISGFVIPYLILHSYGSEANGLVNSISEFLKIVGYMDMGVGAVIQSSLYKPLAKKDMVETRKIIETSRKFYRRLSYVYVGYILILCIIYPNIIRSNFSVKYITCLIVLIGASQYIQYFFGVSNYLLVRADQRGYIEYGIYSLTSILNTMIVGILVVFFSCPIHIIYAVILLLYAIRPIIIHMYVKKSYDFRMYNGGEAKIEQKWNGLLNQISGFVMNRTDLIILTLFVNLQSVSIYSVYALVISAPTFLISGLSSSFTSFFGKKYYMEDGINIGKICNYMQWIINNTVIILYSCIANLLIPFVLLYTKNVDDTNYIQLNFSLILILANMFIGLLSSYNLVIVSTGRFKETQGFWLITATINLSISLILSFTFGLIGVAIGTLIAAIFQYLWQLLYVRKNIIRMSHYLKFLIQAIVGLFFVIWMFWLRTNIIGINVNSYKEWVVQAALCLAVTVLLASVMNFIYFREYFEKMFYEVRRFLKL